MNFEGEDDRSGDLVAHLKMRIEMAGVYWFEILLDDRGKVELLTRLPLRVNYLPHVSPQTGSAPGGQPGA